MAHAIIRTREAWLSALALFLAIRILEALQHPPLDDLEGMQALLREGYPTYAAKLGAMQERRAGSPGRAPAALVLSAIRR